MTHQKRSTHPGARRLEQATTIGLPLLVIAYLLTGLTYIWVTPALEKPDEDGHYGYLRYLREHRAVPPLTPETGLTFQYKQPPLYYVVSALATARLADVADPQSLMTPNAYTHASVPGMREDNRNVYLHPPHLTPFVFGARLASLVFGLGTLLSTYLLALQLFPNRPDRALASAAVVGFQSKWLFIATAINNDAAVTFFATALLALLFYRLRHPRFRAFPWCMGALLGLATLAKVSALGFLPLVGASLLIHRRRVSRTLLRDLAIMALLAVILGGGWYVRNAIVYSDPFTTEAHDLAGAPPRSVSQRVLTDIRDIERTFWGNHARVFVSLAQLDRAALWWGRLSLGAGALALLRSRRRLANHLPTLLTLLLWPLTFLVLLLGFWTRTYAWAWGRFLLPAVAPVMLLLLWSWYYAFPLRWGAWMARASTAFVVMVGIVTPWLVIRPLYHPYREIDPDTLDEPTEIVYRDPQGQPMAILLRAEPRQDQAPPGSYAPVELCWKPLVQTETPYAVFVQLLDAGMLLRDELPSVWGRRETYPGLGNRPTDRWPVGRVFCDTLLTKIANDAPTPLAVALEVGFVEPESGERLQPTDIQGVPLGIVALPGLAILEDTTPPTAAMAAARYVLNEQILLHRATAELTNETLTVTTTWQTTAPLNYDAILFVKVQNARGEFLAEHDRHPMDGRFPTSYWIPGQVVTDTVGLALSARSAVNSLTLQLGMYIWPDLTRLPVVDAAGTPQPHNIIMLTLPLSEAGGQRYTLCFGQHSSNPPPTESGTMSNAEWIYLGAEDGPLKQLDQGPITRLHERGSQ